MVGMGLKKYPEPATRSQQDDHRTQSNRLLLQHLVVAYDLATISGACCSNLLFYMAQDTV